MSDEATGKPAAPDAKPKVDYRPKVSPHVMSGLKIMGAFYRAGGAENFVPPGSEHTKEAKRDLDAAADWIERFEAWTKRKGAKQSGEPTEELTEEGQ